MIEKITEDEAIRFATEHLCQDLKIKLFREIPSGCAFYGYDPSMEFLVSYELNGINRVGGDQYLTVSINNGSVRNIGFSGE